MLTMRPHPLRAHVRRDRLGAAEVAEHLHVHVVPEERRSVMSASFGGGAWPAGIAGAVDEDVDAAQRVDGARHHCLDRVAPSPCRRRRARHRRPVSPASSPAVASRRSGRARAITTSHPSAASARATALPMPRLPPVTMARLSVSSRSIPPSWPLGCTRTVRNGLCDTYRASSSALPRGAAVKGARDPDQQTKAAQFLARHHGPTPLLMPNPWDAGSARLARLPRLRGPGHDQQRVRRHPRPPRRLRHARRGPRPRRRHGRGHRRPDLGRPRERVRRRSRGRRRDASAVAIAAGLAGCSVEDFTGRRDDPIYAAGLAADRVRSRGRGGPRRAGPSRADGPRREPPPRPQRPRRHHRPPAVVPGSGRRRALRAGLAGGRRHPVGRHRPSTGPSTCSPCPTPPRSPSWPRRRRPGLGRRWLRVGGPRRRRRGGARTPRGGHVRLPGKRARRPHGGAIRFRVLTVRWWRERSDAATLQRRPRRAHWRVGPTATNAGSMRRPAGRRGRRRPRSGRHRADRGLAARTRPSPVSAVAGRGVDVGAGSLKDLAVSLFGTNDKGALVVGIVIVSLGARRRWSACWPAGAAGAVRSPSPAPRVVGVLAVRADPQGPLAAGIVACGLGAARRCARARDLLRLAVPRPAIAQPTQLTSTILAIEGRRPPGVPLRRGRREPRPLRHGRRRSSPPQHRAGATRRATTVLPDPTADASPSLPQQPFQVDGLAPYVTPNDRFYRIDTAIFVPAGRRRRRGGCTITGRVDRPAHLQLRRPRWPWTSSRSRSPWRASRTTSAATSSATRVWRGVPLTSLLDQPASTPTRRSSWRRSVDDFTVGCPRTAGPRRPHRAWSPSA